MAEDADFVIRERVAADLPGLREVYLRARRHAFSWVEEQALEPQDFDRDSEGERVWVAARGEQVVGFVAAWPPENFVHHLYVLPEWAGRGVGTRLLDRCLAELGRPARLKCVTANVPALRFYRARGWRAVETGVGPDGEYLLLQFDAGTC